MQALLAAVSGYFSPKKRKSSTTDIPLLHIAPLSIITLSLLREWEQCGLLLLSNVRCKHSSKRVAKCDKIMELRVSTLYKMDGHALVCPVHGRHYSVRAGSWFASHRLPLSELLYIFDMLRCRTPCNSIARVFAGANLYRETITKVLHDLQAKMWSSLQQNHLPTFDPSDVLEIDEMWMDWKRWENEVGTDARFKEWEGGQWVIGLVNRARTKLWIECIPSRKRVSIKAVVDPLLRSWLLRKPRIHTDALKSYEYLAKENTHYIINKKQDGFAIETTTFWGNTINVNVNAIENTWRHLRAHLALRHAYRTPQHAQLHIAEFVYNWYQLSWSDLIKIS